MTEDQECGKKVGNLITAILFLGLQLYILSIAYKFWQMSDWTNCLLTLIFYRLGRLDILPREVKVVD